MPSPSDIPSAAAVAAATEQTFARLFPRAEGKTVRRLFSDIDDLFNGRLPDYQACDLKYHDYRHTLQVAHCFVALFAGRHAADETPPLNTGHFETGLAAALYHDSGYLKTRGDTTGTGAKYTYCHVLRSCALAASHLPRLNFTIEEIDAVLGAIRRTGPLPVGSVARSGNGAEEFVACAVASADYLAQMAASDYPDELDLLHAEFAESDDFLAVPAARRMFKSLADLRTRTGKFWVKVVRPKLDTDFKAVHRYLDAPDGSNPWLEAIERNLAVIAERARSA
jgi:hypothetical protein